MSTHPYWAYQAVPGSIAEAKEEQALAEGRRALALELAVQHPSVDEDDVDRARRFEEYLKGGDDDGDQVRLRELPEAGDGDQEQPVQESLERRW